MQRLSDGEIHLWFAVSGDAGDPPKPASVDPILDDGEKARTERLRSPAGRRLFETSHTLVRRALSRYSAISPGEWRFVEDAQGKPRIDPELDSPALSFSLAHTKGLAVVAVTGGADIGVDLEREDRRVDAARLSSRFFSPDEAAALRILSPDRLREHFPLYWTLKEAYIKARGLGLSLPLDSFSFHLEGEIPFRIGFSADRTEGSGEWRFAVIRPLPQYVAAVAVHPAPAGPVRIRCFHPLPSGDISPLNIEFMGLSTGVERDRGI